MCGRFVLDLRAHELSTWLGADWAGGITGGCDGEAEAWRPSYNIAPGGLVPALEAADGTRRLRLVRWGVPRRGSARASLINARSETAATSPRFAEAMRRHRVLVPATGFYEWSPEAEGRAPHLFVGAAARGLLMASLLLPEEPPGVVILTREAVGVVAPIHDREPLLLEAAFASRWLDATTPAVAVSDLVECAPPRLRRLQVSRTVNRAGADGPDVAEPIGPGVSDG
jgi:putative SOS response-associated peptidase YedK